ncbi:MAG: HK97 family phage prohead protease [Actinomycetota bacterium]|nr:HK97 family phage prohead protease [Actinomycetota bacterium]
MKRRLVGPQKRAVTLDGIELRAGTDSTATTFVGHAAVFNSPTLIGGQRYGFMEQVAPGAFRKTIKDADVRFLFNHDPNFLLARTKAGTLRLDEDDTGLHVEADLEDSDPDAARVLGKMRSGLLDQMSFAFESLAEEVDTLDDGMEIRTLTEVKLWDVSVVTYPAYGDTDAALRSSAAFDAFCRGAGFDAERRNDFIDALLNDTEVDLTKIAAGLMSREEITGRELAADDPEPGSSTRDAESQPAQATGTPLTLMQRRLHLAARKHGFSV